MAIAQRAVSSAASTSAALPAVAAGDLLVGIAFRDSNQSGPSLPAGWTLIANTTAGGAPGMRMAYRFWQSGDTAPTWTNASAVVIASYSGVDPTTPIGTVSTPNTDVGTGTSITIPGLTLAKTDGTSWVVAGYQHRNAFMLDTPSGMTEDVDSAHATTARYGYSHTTGGVASFISRSIGGPTVAAAWRSVAVELLAAADSGTTGTLSGASSVTGQTVQVAIRTGSSAASSAAAGSSVEVEQSAGTASAVSSVTGQTTQVAIRTGSASGASAVTGTTDSGQGAVTTTGSVTGTSAAAGTTLQVAIRSGTTSGNTAVAGASVAVHRATGAIATTSAVTGVTRVVAYTNGTAAGLAAAAGQTVVIDPNVGKPVARPRLTVVTTDPVLTIRGTGARLTYTTHEPTLTLGDQT